ncbi:hypothetical protein B0H17DRAFT_1134754 [Mycena rosella]|uniref:Secreted protein n=1 Tax=Mycena rosella TaxID=1033263 RepID=A0AAD7DEJ4_MYCRO|nr:hypothetical protein B0H17DRAFT_1134754 [Mycena rosella]
MAALVWVLTVCLWIHPLSILAITFHSVEGFKLVREILLDVLPTFDPHSYQINGVCKVLDKVDLVVAVTPTGSGRKTRQNLTRTPRAPLTAHHYSQIVPASRIKCASEFPENGRLPLTFRD